MIETLFADPRVRFLFAGGSAALVNWLVRFPLGLLLPYSSAVLVAQGIGMAYGFVIYRNWAFRPTTARGLWREIRDFLLVNAAGIAITLAVAIGVAALFGALGVPAMFGEAAAHAIGIGFGAVANYFGHRYVTFR